MDSFGTQQQQQQQRSSSGSVRVLLLAWADSTRLPTTVYSTIYKFISIDVPLLVPLHVEIVRYSFAQHEQ